jgi:hypothetical protein
MGRTEGNIIYLFEPESEDESQDTSEEHPLDALLSVLLRWERLTEREIQVIESVLEPLRARFPVLKTVGVLRLSILRGRRVDALSIKEKALWAEKNIFPWFDLAGATVKFLVSQERADRSVLFFREEYRHKIDRYIDPNLAQHVHGGAAAIGIEGPEQAAWFERVMKKATGGRPEAIIKEFENYTGTGEREVRNLAGYIKRFSQCIHYEKFQSEGLPIGSGEIEALCPLMARGLRFRLTPSSTETRTAHALRESAACNHHVWSPTRERLGPGRRPETANKRNVGECPCYH